MIGNAALRKIITTKATHPVKLSERAAASQTDDGYSLKTLVSLQWGLSWSSHLLSHILSRRQLFTLENTYYVCIHVSIQGSFILVCHRYINFKNPNSQSWCSRPAIILNQSTYSACLLCTVILFYMLILSAISLTGILIHARLVSWLSSVDYTRTVLMYAPG